MKLKRSLRKSLWIIAAISMMTTSLIAAPTTEKKELDLDYAIKSAISRDNTLVVYNRALDVYAEQKKTMDDLGSAAYSSKVIEINETNEKIQFQKDRLAKDVTEQYQNMVLLQKNIELFREQIILNEQQVKQATIKKEKGYIDELAYEKTVQVLENTKSSKVQMEKQLEDAQKSFLKLTNIKVENYTLKVDDTYEPFVLDKSVTAYATGMATKLVKYADEKAQLGEDRFWDNFSEGPAPTYDVYLATKVNIQNNKDNAKSAYDTYKLLIETKYTALNAQMDTINTKVEEYKTAVKDMKVLEIKYKAGYVSKIDYEAQSTALMAKQVDYLSEVYKYNIMKMQFEKPWTMNEYGF